MLTLFAGTADGERQVAVYGGWTSVQVQIAQDGTARNLRRLCALSGRRATIRHQVYSPAFQLTLFLCGESIHVMMDMRELVGIGLYTPAEASRLCGIASKKLIRWLHGHNYRGKEYPSLWRSQVDLGDGRVYLGFRDLMEARVADKFIKEGISALRVRQAIILAREVLGTDRPLSTNRFRTDGRTIFLRTTETDGDGKEREQLLNLFKHQYEFASIINPILKDVVFDDAGTPASWWPAGQGQKIIVDPRRAFGQPIDSESSVPVTILAGAGKRYGVEVTARSYEVSRGSVRRAMHFAGVRELPRAA